MDEYPIQDVTVMTRGLLSLGVGRSELRAINADAPSDGLVELAERVVAFWRDVLEVGNVASTEG